MTRHIVGLSGGKDSTAMALRLQEIEPRDYEYVITPTGDELPPMIEHWLRCAQILGKPLTVISSGKSLKGLIRDQNALPNNRQRWCTRMLKIIPFEHFLFDASPAVTYIGLRADEEEREGGIYTHIEGITQRFPMREWGWKIEDVFCYLKKREVVIPIRTDCARCYEQRIIEWRNLWRDYPEIYADAEADEEMTGFTFRSPTRDTWPAALKDLRKEFERGRPIRGEGKEAERNVCRVCSM